MFVRWSSPSHSPIKYKVSNQENKPNNTQMPLRTSFPDSTALAGSNSPTYWYWQNPFQLSIWKAFCWRFVSVKCNWCAYSFCSYSVASYGHVFPPPSFKIMTLYLPGHFTLVLNCARSPNGRVIWHLQPSDYLILIIWSSSSVCLLSGIEGEHTIGIQVGKFLLQCISQQIIPLPSYQMVYISCY